MSINELIKVLTEKNWELKGTNQKFQFYVPPQDLGFEKSYVLPVPTNEKSADYEKALQIAANVLAETYQTDISQLITNISNYLNVLKKDAVYFKLAGEEDMFAKTLEINDIWQFLKNLSSSYQSYLEINFVKYFKNIYSGDKLKKLIEPVIRYSRLRLVDLQYKSFSIGVSADSMMGNDTIQFKDVSQWRQKKIQSYKNEILEMNFNDRESIETLVNKYNVNERRKIFDPLIKSINSHEHTIYLTDSTFKPKRELRKLPNSTVETILPLSMKQKAEQNMDLVEVITMYDKSQKYLKLKTEDLGKNIFSQSINEFKWRLPEISFDNQIITFTQPIEYKLKVYEEESVIKASHEILPLNATSADLKQIKIIIENQIVGFYRKYLEIKDSNDLDIETKKIVDYFNKIL